MRAVGESLDTAGLPLSEILELGHLWIQQACPCLQYWNWVISGYSRPAPVSNIEIGTSLDTAVLPLSQILELGHLSIQ